MIILHERHSPTLLPHLRVYVCGWTVKYALRNVHKDNRVYILGIIADFLRTWFDLTFCYAIFPYKIKMGDCAQPCAPSTNLPSAPSTNLPSIPSTQPQHPAMEFGLGDSMPAPAPSEGVWFGGTPCRLGDSMPAPAPSEGVLVWGDSMPAPAPSEGVWFGGTPCRLGDSMPAPAPSEGVLVWGDSMPFGGLHAVWGDSMLFGGLHAVWGTPCQPLAPHTTAPRTAAPHTTAPRTAAPRRGFLFFFFFFPSSKKKSGMAQAIPTLMGKVGDFHKQPTRITQLYYERILKKLCLKKMYHFVIDVFPFHHSIRVSSVIPTHCFTDDSQLIF